MWVLHLHRCADLFLLCMCTCLLRGLLNEMQRRAGALGVAEVLTGVCVAARTGAVMAEFGRLYEQQYGVALFNSVRFDLEGGGGPQSQLLQRKVSV